MNENTPTLDALNDILEKEHFGRPLTKDEQNKILEAYKKLSYKLAETLNKLVRGSE